MKKIDISTKKHPRTFTFIDNEDYFRVTKCGWFAACSKGKFYARNTVTKELLHRYIMRMGKYDGINEIDHRDGDGLNNQKFNLRICTHAENIRNKKIQRNNTSGYKGVSWSKQRKLWRCAVKFEWNTIVVGHYFCLIKAAKAYDEKTKLLYGEFSKPNFNDRRLSK